MFPLKIVIFNSYVKLPEGTVDWFRNFWLKKKKQDIPNYCHVNADWQHVSTNKKLDKSGLHGIYAVAVGLKIFHKRAPVLYANKPYGILQ